MVKQLDLSVSSALLTDLGMGPGKSFRLLLSTTMALLRVRLLLIAITWCCTTISSNSWQVARMILSDHCMIIFANMGWQRRRHLFTVTHLLMDFNDLSMVSIELQPPSQDTPLFHADSTGSVRVKLRGSPCSACRQT